MKICIPYFALTPRSRARRGLWIAALAGGICGAGTLHAQTLFNFTGAKSNLWDDPTTDVSGTIQPNWSPQTIPPAPPNSAQASVLIPGARNAVLNFNFLIGRLGIAATGTVTIGNQLTLSVQAGAFGGSGTIDNAGTISARDFGVFGIVGGGTLTGGGVVTLSGTSAATGYGGIGSGAPGFGGRLTNVNNTIQGAGVVGQSFAGGGQIALTNQGLIDANVLYDAGAGNSLSVIFDTLNPPDGNGNFGINTGTLRASNGGLLFVLGTLTNTGGTIQALNNSVVRLNNDTIIQGGTLASAGTGVVRVLQGTVSLKSVANAGALDVQTGSTLYVFGTTTNSGSITLNGGAGSAFLRAGAGGATLTGGGSVVMVPSFDNRILGGGLVNQDNTLSGAGAIVSGFAAAETFINHGVVDANVPYNPGAPNPLAIHERVTNTGTLRASNGGRLQFDPGFNGAFDNTGGIIEALNGSKVVINGNSARITGGTLSTTGSGLIEATNVILQNLNNAGSFVERPSSILHLIGTIQNSGSLVLEGNANLFVGGSGVTLSGSGVLTLGGGQVTGNGGFSFTNQGNTLRGQGVIANSVNLINRALLDANVPYDPQPDNVFSIFPSAAAVNSGTMQASGGGRLRIVSGAIDNTGGSIRALEGSVVDLRNGLTITGGTLSTSGTGVVQLNSFFPVTLTNLTTAGDLQVNSFSSQLSGAIHNTGTISVGPTGASGLDVFGAGVTLTGGGSLTLRSNSFLRALSAGQTLNNQSTIRGGGSIDSLIVTNSGLIEATDATFALVITPTSLVNAAGGVLRGISAAGLRLSGGAFTNNGLFEVTNGSNLTILANATLTNYSAQTLTGGSYRITSTGSASTLDLQGRTILTNNADVTLSGANSVFAAINGLTNNEGSFAIRDGRNFVTAGELTNNGTITVGNGSTLTFTGNVTGTGALNIGNGGTVGLGGSAPPAPGEFDFGVWESGAQSAAVPEPGVGALLLSALALLGFRGARASRVLERTSLRSRLGERPRLSSGAGSARRRDAFASTRDERAPRNHRTALSETLALLWKPHAPSPGPPPRGGGATMDR